MFDADDRAEQAHRHDEDHGQRQRPAFVLGRQHQEDHHDGEAEDDHGRVAGQQLQVRHVGPLEASCSAAIPGPASRFKMSIA